MKAAPAFRWLLPALCLFVGGCAIGPAQPRAKLSVRLTGARAEGDRVTVSAQGEQVILEVYSQSGIGQAEITAEGGGWPGQLILRLHLRGLESFEVDNGRFTIRTQVSSSPPHDQRCEWFPAGRSGQGTSVDLDSPYWISLRIVPEPAPGTPTIPLDGGYFELTLPPVLLEDGPQTLSLKWIDFYRG